MKPKPPVPKWRWAVWYSALAAALVLFYGLFTPVAVVFRMLKRDALRRKRPGSPRSGSPRRRRAGSGGWRNELHHTYDCVGYCVMPTNLDIDQNLLARAKRAGKHKSKKEAVNAALQEYIQRREQARIIEAFGTVDFDPAYDYKKQRKRA